MLRQGLQVGLLRLKLRLVLVIQLGHQRGDKGLIVRHAGKVGTASQVERLGDAIFQMPMGRLNGSVLMGNARVVAGGAEPVVVTEIVIQARQGFPTRPTRIAIRRAQTIGAMFLRGSATSKQRIL